MTSLFSQICFKFLLLVFLLSHGNSQPQQDNGEQAVLLKLKQHLQNPPSLSHWTSSSNATLHCSWPEIICTDSSVTGLSLINKDIKVTIPPSICDLKNLTYLALQFNYIPGEFPTALYNCSKLQYLDLSQNYFVGPIPDDIDRLSQLQYLSLGANNFSGDIPAAIGRLLELRNLQLYQNQFNDSYPAEIGDLSELEYLAMATNMKFLPSRLPKSFTQLKKLQVLWMSDSNLIGEIPDTVGDLAALEILDLSGNSLTGKIPDGLFMLKNLSELYLYKNKFSGEIPQVIEASNLIALDLSMNNLTGKIPDDIGKLQKLTNLSLFFNQLSGEIPQSLGQMPTLKDVRLYSNNLIGVLPPDFGRYSRLEGFEVASNRLTGRLPEHLCSGGKLKGVVAFDNNLTGELPESLGNCSSLKVVMIQNNGFSGNIPNGLWTSVNLLTMMISDNLFTGKLPGKVSQKLSLLHLSNNRFSGAIPAGVSSWQNLVVFNASNNLLNGTIPRELTALSSLNTLLLDQNQLQGSLPSEIVSWKSLVTLNLSRNQLSGQIPASIGFLENLLDLDLSVNQFSGQIPWQIGRLRLNFLNLSSNYLTGKIPSQFENTAFSDSFLNNSGLCKSTPAVVDINPRSSSPNFGRNFRTYRAVVLSCVMVITVLSLLSSFLLIRFYWKRNQELNITWKLTPFQRLNFTESEILLGLTDHNVIGSGGSGEVYRVSVTHSHYVAVKRIWNDSKLDRKLEKEFLAEVNILGAIQHRNIVKLLCCISGENSKLLVYEYLENHSLDGWLHKRKSPSAILDWQKRLKIAVGAAQGLCYMHHYCSPPIVHRDVKSSNILLDSEFNAKIADFGLARMLIRQEELATVSVVAGSFGYIAPEYAQKKRVNEKIDVYSFGVILLELTTGKKANHGDEHSSLAQWAQRYFQEGKPVVDALDEDIKEPCYLDEICVVFRLGIICTSIMPSARPSMKEVLEILLCRGHPTSYLDKKSGSEFDAAPLLDI
ncbi:hypothetical protein SLE2022_160980 [Rubroshorea leprosula]